nr:rab5 GDP/GTP exchange factor-like isoform X1 [Lytechinus pictus]
MESQRAMGDFMEFLKILNRPAAQDLNKQCRAFVERLQRESNLSVEEQAELVQDFYHSMGDRMSTHSAFKGMSSFSHSKRYSSDFQEATGKNRSHDQGEMSCIDIQGVV